MATMVCVSTMDSRFRGNDDFWVVLWNANQVGLFNVVQMMKKFQQNPLDDAKFWEPAPLIKRLVAEGKNFA